jgi:hypothetical protein
MTRCAHQFGYPVRVLSWVTGKQHYIKYWCLKCKTVHCFVDNLGVPSVDQVAA